MTTPQTTSSFKYNSQTFPNTDILALLGDQASLRLFSKFEIKQPNKEELLAYYKLRRQVFVEEQGIFDKSDLDEIDSDSETIVFVAIDKTGRVLGGVRLAPTSKELGQSWWSGSRLVVDKASRGTTRIAISLIKNACKTAEQRGALRFDATVQLGNKRFFESLGWKTIGHSFVAGVDHLKMDWPINRLQKLADSTKSNLGSLLLSIQPGGYHWIGDDAAPIPDSNLVAACDSILPSIIERDPQWGGWCGVVVNANDIAAMGAEPAALLDAVSGPSEQIVQQILIGVKKAADAYGIPIIGGHSQIGVSCGLSITMLGKTNDPIPSGGGQVGDEVSLSIDLNGNWRKGYEGTQWDSTTFRNSSELRKMIRLIKQARPNSAKDVSMAGIVGTLGMLAESSGCGAEIEVGLIPRPKGVNLADWLSCFPGFAMISTQSKQRPNLLKDINTDLTSVVCGKLIQDEGVYLVWPDGTRTQAIKGSVTGLGPIIKL